jgi:hypothetical protein
MHCTRTTTYLTEIQVGEYFGKKIRLTSAEAGEWLCPLSRALRVCMDRYIVVTAAREKTAIRDIA